MSFPVSLETESPGNNFMTLLHSRINNTYHFLNPGPCLKTFFARVETYSKCKIIAFKEPKNGDLWLNGSTYQNGFKVVGPNYYGGPFGRRLILKKV